jgi:EF-P beta-lysylation protein EpmB
MIAPIAALSHPQRWQDSLRDAVTDPDELLSLLGLDPALAGPARLAAERFPLRVPRGFVARMERGNPADPLLRQVLPLDAELEEAPGFQSDPVGDLASAEATGVLHKYEGRTLLITTGACAVHCRYCFRREFPYAEQLASAGRWSAALAALRRDPAAREVILSGGDPWSLSNARLDELLEGLESVPHVERLRIHTRQPVVLPERLDRQLLAWLARGRLRKVVVIHANHARELDGAVERALASAAATGVTLLNQSVLLRGVNDSADALVSLSERLFQCGVLPYYLHLLDRVRGSGHFEVPEDQAVRLLEAVRQRLPGYLVPRLVREVAGHRSKTPVA